MARRTSNHLHRDLRQISAQIRPRTTKNGPETTENEQGTFLEAASDSDASLPRARIDPKKQTDGHLGAQTDTHPHPKPGARTDGQTHQKQMLATRTSNVTGNALRSTVCGSRRHPFFHDATRLSLGVTQADHRRVCPQPRWEPCLASGAELPLTPQSREPLQGPDRAYSMVESLSRSSASRSQ